jgi:hypothetical protein
VVLGYLCRYGTYIHAYFFLWWGQVAHVLINFGDFFVLCSLVDYTQPPVRDLSQFTQRTIDRISSQSESDQR